MKKILSLAVLVCVGLFALKSSAGAITLKAFRDRPKLVVVIVIDQFRADYLTRFENRFLPSEAHSKLGGFNYLMAKSAYFPIAKYDILQSMTCPGHATVLTGSYPYMNGVVMNAWYDRGEKHFVYCVEDKDFGFSPRRLVGTTVSDEMKSAGFKGKVISLALKDRSAIMLGGHRADAAFWFDPEFRWVSSKYYFSDGKVPEWVEKLNSKLAVQKGKPYTFKSSGSGNGMSGNSPNFSYSTQIGTDESLGSPLGVSLTTDMAINALHEYKMGSSPNTDFLTISYSSHDMLGHEKGANSREMEELTVAEDASIAELINAVRDHMKSHFQDVVFVLTADHGVAPGAEHMKAGKADIDIFSYKKMRDDLEQKMTTKFGKVDGGWILEAYSLNFYLNLSAAASKKLTVREVEEFAKTELLKTPGMLYAFSKSDYDAKTVHPGQIERQIMKTYNPKISGDVIVIPQVFNVEQGHVGVHMTGYNYDRTVPLIIAGKSIKPGVYSDAVEVVDLAPTLSFLLGILPPALSEGRVLKEAF